MLQLSSKNPSQDAVQGSRKVKVALTSCGLGRVHRGFEVSTARWFEILKEDPRLDVRLYSGGPYDGATEVLNIPRDFLLDTVLYPVTFFNRRRVWEFAYGTEMVTYAFGVIGELIKFKPDIVWTKEAPMSHILLALKTIFNLKFKIVFANGGGYKPSTYAIFDHVQQLETVSFDDAVSFGVPAEKMSVIPNVIPYTAPRISRLEARSSFGFSDSDFVVMCAAAWNIYHKRIDVLIEEAAALNDPSLNLLLCGHPEPDLAKLKALGEKLLPGRVKWHTLPMEEMPRALRAADAFVLPSIRELFGSAAVEAIMAELPTVVHPNGGTALLGDTPFKTCDLTVPGAITKALLKIKTNPGSLQELAEIAAYARLKFAKDGIADQFVSMSQKLAFESAPG